MARDPEALGPLTPDDVGYLAFEGGGGKGIAFLGAIQALEELDVLRFTTGPAPFDPPGGRFHWLPRGIDPGRRLITGSDDRRDDIAGISGASAGAITALLLSCGYNADDIRRIMTLFDFDRFFEKPTPRVVPRIQIDRTSLDYSGIEPVPYQPGNEASDSGWLQQVILRGLGPFMPLYRLSRRLRAELARRAWNEVLEAARTALDAAAALGADVPVAVRMLLAHFANYFEFVGRDLGFFPGYEARKFFAEVIAYKMPLLNGRPQYNATFQDHFNEFKVRLVITGTNVETGKSGLFSKDTTPNFPVADAVRISMSLPLAYKPLVIRPEHYRSVDLPDWVEGVWVDGGYLNNIPLHVFDHERDGLRRTLGLRLEIEEAPQPIEHLGHLLLRWPLAFGFMGAGEAHVGPATRNDSQTITLDTKGLSLFQFSAPPDKIDAVSKRSRDEVLNYFDPEGKPPTSGN